VFDGNGELPPADAVELVQGFVRGAQLQESVRMTTIRRRTEMHDVDGRLIAGVVDDAVSVPNGAGPAAAFRELEVEIGAEMTPDLLDALVERLRQAGAGSPDQTAKYIRALAPATPLTPEIAVADLGPGASAGDVVGRAIALSVIRLVRHDPVVRLDVDPEGVHQARVATRRLRSDLRTFRPLVDEKWGSALRAELGWIARILGEVRDGDVLLARLHHAASELADAGESAAPVVEALQASRDAAHVALLDALRSDRYASLLDRLVEAANAPVLARASAEPAADAIPALVRRPWHRLSKRAKALGPAPTDAQLHELRIRTKRVRYAAEAATPVVGKQARGFARAAASLQDVLGDLNDAVVAAAWLAGWSARDAEAAHAAAQLAASERSTAEALRGHWRAAWEELANPELRAWM
jgi:CHAD domain-containing protein